MLLNTFVGCLAQLDLPGGSAAAENTPPSSGGSMMQYLFPMMAVMLLVMILTRKKPGNAQKNDKLKSLKKNDRIVTIGGIIGTVMSIRDDANYVTLRIDEASNTKMQIRKSSILEILDGNEKTSTDKSA